MGRERRGGRAARVSLAPRSHPHPPFPSSPPTQLKVKLEELAEVYRQQDTAALKRTPQGGGGGGGGGLLARLRGPGSSNAAKK